MEARIRLLQRGSNWLSAQPTPLPSSDEEGGKAAGFDGWRDNAHGEFELSIPVLRHGLLSLSHRYAMPAPSSEGAEKGTTVRDISFAALNLWAAKRGLVIS